MRLEVFKQLFAAVAEEMGGVLRRSSFSPNIKERRDFSCAVFDARGRMVAQAAHIPVHLGAMPLSVLRCVEELELGPGDVGILNDPFRGGTHLPDITLVTPVFEESSPPRLLGFVASRAHHADVGGISPGSMGLARTLNEEGLVIPPIKLVASGRPVPAVWAMLRANVRTPREREGDLRAQLAANERGAARLRAVVRRYGIDAVDSAMAGLLRYAERSVRALLARLPDGSYRFEDHLDDDGISPEPVPIRVTLTVRGDGAVVDFTGSGEQCAGPLNAVYAIVVSACFYAFRSLVGREIPSNAGCLVPVRVVAPEGTVVNARPPAAVAGGNVETSQRIVDVLLGALAQACPARVPAASQGTMNNLTIGGWNPERHRPFAYYETVGGGCGARPDRDGASAVHSHMTNTLNTPVEALEFAYPLRVKRYEVRRGSGGEGRYRGGDGIRRDVELLVPAHVSVLSERRARGPYGLAGGEAGRPGRNVLVRGGAEKELPGKVELDALPGDVISIRTPGGGGHGAATRPPAGGSAPTSLEGSSGSNDADERRGSVPPVPDGRSGE